MGCLHVLGNVVQFAKQYLFKCGFFKTLYVLACCMPFFQPNNSIRVITYFVGLFAVCTLLIYVLCRFIRRLHLVDSFKNLRFLFYFSQEDRVVILRFGRDHDEVCMLMDETLFNVADTIKNFASIFLVCHMYLPSIWNNYHNL